MSQSTQQKAPSAIPIRSVVLRDMSQLPSDYSSSPGGTLFSTTPGGTRIVYDRSFLLNCRNSPLSKTPPTNLPDIPGVTTPKKSQTPKKENSAELQRQRNKSGGKDDVQFAVEM